MDPLSDNFQPDQRNALLNQIRSAQDLGADCFLRNNEDIYEVKIRPGDSAELSMRSLEAAGGVDFTAVSFSFTPAEGVFQLCSSLVEGAGELRPEEFTALFNEHPLEQVSSLHDLAVLFYEHFDSGTDWRVYTCFLKSLPDELSDDLVQRIVVPLLEAGELGVAVNDAEEFLRARGWTAEQIRASYSLENRIERTARHYFFEFTGTPVSEITSSAELATAIQEKRQQGGNAIAASLIVYYVQAHFSEQQVAHLAPTIEPFLHSFGPAVYRQITDAYWCCEHAMPYVPPYNGPDAPFIDDEP